MIGHISDLQWDRLLADELPEDVGEALRAHADECAACSSRLRELTAARDAFRLRPFAIPGRQGRGMSGSGGKGR